MAIRKGQKQRNKVQLANHMYHEAKLYLEGYSYRQIAAMLNISITTISHDLKLVRERWVQSAVIDFTERQGAELEKIDMLEVEYLNGYKDSKEPKVITTVKQIPYYRDKKTGKKRMYVNENGELAEGFLQREKAGSIVIEENVRTEKTKGGESKWLDGIARCIDMRLRIFGLYRANHPAGSSENPADLKDSSKIKVALFLGLLGEWQKQQLQ